MKTLISTLSTLLLLITFTFCSKNVNAQAGNALYFDGDDDYIDMGNVDLDLTNQVTIMTWVNWAIDPSSGNNFTTFVCNNSEQESNNGQIWLQHDNGNLHFEFDVSIGSVIKTAVSTTSPVSGQWYHLAGTYDGSNVVIYVNGIPEDTFAASGQITDFNSEMLLTLGGSAKNSNGYRRFNGTMDEVSIWNVALSASQIQNMYQYALTGGEVGLKGYWAMNESSGTTVLDGSPSGFDGDNKGTADIIVSTAPLLGTLPVELISFTASDDPDGILLTWLTASETHNDHFTLETSTDLENWLPLTKISGSGTTNSITSYTYIDENVHQGKVYYRLLQTDYNGHTEVVGTIAHSSLLTMESIAVYPNPANDWICLSKANSGDQIIILDMFGRIVSEIFVSNDSETRIDISGIPKGLYVIKTVNTTNIVNSGVFTVE